jgi:hypothetical protein
VKKEEKEISRVFPEEVQVDLYKFVQWGLLAARLIEGVKEETVKVVTAFIADTQMHTNLMVTIRPCKVEYGGSLVDGWFCSISGAKGIVPYRGWRPDQAGDTGVGYESGSGSAMNSLFSR